MSQEKRKWLGYNGKNGDGPLSGRDGAEVSNTKGNLSYIWINDVSRLDGVYGLLG